MADAAAIGSLLADSRLERLLTIAQQVNDLLSKIQTASTYLTEIPEAEDFEEVFYSKNQFIRDLKVSVDEAQLLLPAVDEIISKLEEQKRDLESKRKISLGLAKIEGLGDTTKEKDFIDAARQLADQKEDLGNTIRALEAFTMDLSTKRRAPISCPRCSSHSISYKISQSDFGFTLYSCNKCTNAWKTTSFTIHMS